MNLLGQCEPLYHIHSNTIYLYCFPISMVIFYFFYGIWTLQVKPRLLDLFLINMAVSYFFSKMWTLQVNLDRQIFIKSHNLFLPLVGCALVVLHLNISDLWHVTLHLPYSNFAHPANLTKNSFAAKNQVNRLKTFQAKGGHGSLNNLGCSIVGLINTYIYIYPF